MWQTRDPLPVRAVRELGAVIDIENVNNTAALVDPVCTSILRAKSHDDTHSSGQPILIPHARQPPPTTAGTACASGSLISPSTARSPTAKRPASPPLAGIQG